MVLRFVTARQRRVALAGAMDPDEPVDHEFDVQLAGRRAIAAITPHSFWVVPLGENRDDMVAPAISVITAVGLRGGMRRTALSVATPGGSIEVTARRRDSHRLFALLTSHPEYRGLRNGSG